jgi:hypothetical protein
VRSTADRVSTVVEVVFVFSLAAGLLVLMAAVSASQDERLLEGGVMRAIGGSRRQLRLAQASEFAAIGLLSGLTLRLAELTRRLADLSGARVEVRFARLFLKLCDQIGRKERGGIFVPMPLSRQELADLTGGGIGRGRGEGAREGQGEDHGKRGEGREQGAGGGHSGVGQGVPHAPAALVLLGQLGGGLPLVAELGAGAANDEEGEEQQVAPPVEERVDEEANEEACHHAGTVHGTGRVGRAGQGHVHQDGDQEPQGEAFLGCNYGGVIDQIWASPA